MKTAYYLPCHFDCAVSFSYVVTRKYKNAENLVIRFGIKLCGGMKEFNICSFHEKFQSFTFEFPECRL
jgi:hypothetical protein